MTNLNEIGFRTGLNRRQRIGDVGEASHRSDREESSLLLRIQAETGNIYTVDVRRGESHVQSGAELLVNDRRAGQSSVTISDQLFSVRLCFRFVSRLGRFAILMKLC